MYYISFDSMYTEQKTGNDVSEFIHSDYAILPFNS